MRDLIASIRSEVMGGASFSSALSRHPRDFAEIYRALVSSGEQIGQLARVLSRLADYIERRNALVQRVRLAFTYPAIVTVVAFAIVIFLLTYVVPQIVSVFANTKQKAAAAHRDDAGRVELHARYGIYVGIAIVGPGSCGAARCATRCSSCAGMPGCSTPRCTASSSAA
jgi:general secretion pathway protein F